MNIIKALWDIMNGKKLNTATVIAILIVALNQLGMEKEAATQMVSQIMAGIAGVMALVGFGHRLYKAWKAKKGATTNTEKK